MAGSRNKEIPGKNVDFIRDRMTINFYNIRAVEAKKKNLCPTKQYNINS